MLMITKRIVLLVGLSVYYVTFRDREVDVGVAKLAGLCNWLNDHLRLKKIIAKLCGNIGISRCHQTCKNLSMSQKMTEISKFFIL